MSYSALLKKSLKDQSMKKKCCRRAFFYGENLVLPPKKREGSIDWEKFGYGSEDDLSEVKYTNFKCQSCKNSFLRGVFCAVGTVSDPQKSFHLEIKVANSLLADNLFDFITECGIEMKKTNRNGITSFYLKKADDIEDFLHFLGAGKEAFEIANEKIKRDFANIANRRNNFEVVNLGKTISAAGETTDAIKKLIKKGKLSNLPKGLIETAQLRIDNPFANLEELAAMHSDRISKSGVNHRLKKLIELADED